MDRGLVLYESIRSFLSEFRLYYLCLDEDTFYQLHRVHDKRLVPLLMSDCFQNNSDFQLLMKNNRSVPVGMPEEWYQENNLFPGYSDFHFALGSFFTHYVMQEYTPEDILYVDADIVFYHNPQLVFDSGRKKSIGIIRHRHNEVGCVAGGYNVGVVYFKNNVTGKACLQWWRDVVMNKSNPWFSTHGGCGDQKYLELFIPMFSDVQILDEDIGHGAPWNFSLYRYFDDPYIIEWNGVVQPLVFIHFSHFNYKRDAYRVARRGEWYLHAPAKRYYDAYFQMLWDVRKRYGV